MSKTFRQADSRWGNKPYPSKPYYMKGSGCGCTACADIIVNIPRKEKYTPETIRPWMIKQGFATKGNGTTWAGITKTLQHYGFKVKNTQSIDVFFKEMAKGNRWGIILFKAGTKGGVTWTTGGHYVAVSDYKVKNGKHYLYVRDPGARHNDGWFCYETTMKGLVKNLWAAYL